MPLATCLPSHQFDSPCPSSYSSFCTHCWNWFLRVRIHTFRTALSVWLLLTTFACSNPGDSFLFFNSPRNDGIRVPVHDKTPLWWSYLSTPNYVCGEISYLLFVLNGAQPTPLVSWQDKQELVANLLIYPWGQPKAYHNFLAPPSIRKLSINIVHVSSVFRWVIFHGIPTRNDSFLSSPWVWSLGITTSLFG